MNYLEIAKSCGASTRAEAVMSVVSQLYDAKYGKDG